MIQRDVSVGSLCPAEVYTRGITNDCRPLRDIDWTPAENAEKEKEEESTRRTSWKRKKMDDKDSRLR